MSATNTTPPASSSPPTLSGNAATVSATAGTGAAVGGAVGGPIGAAIGAGIGAVLGALGVMKGKTPHLDFNQSKTIAEQVAVKVNDPIIKFFGYNSPEYSSYGKALAREAAKRISAKLNSSSSSWQTWIGNAIADLNARASAAAGDPGAVIYVYGLYVGMNYDASRLEEYSAVLQNDLLLTFQSLVKEFPTTQALVTTAGTAAAATAVPTKSAGTVLDKVFGGGGSSGAAPGATPAATAGIASGPMDDGKKVLIAGFSILIIGFLLFTKKKKFGA